MKYKHKKTRVSKYISSANDKTSNKGKKRGLTAALVIVACLVFVKSPLKETEYVKKVFVKITDGFDIKASEFLDKTGEYIADFCFGYLKNETKDDALVHAENDEVLKETAVEAGTPYEEAKPRFLPIMPADGEISSEFGERVHPLNEEITFHNGIDIALSEGDEIKACFDGVITKSEYNEYSGNYILITHIDGYTSSYAHMSKLILSEGTAVKKGDVIGLAGSTGMATGPHLHFEIRNEGTPLDPYALITKNE